MSHGGGGEEGDPNRWLVSYADFITLLMVMFVVLYSMGQTDIKKYKQLAESMKVAFGGGGAPVKVIDSKINQGAGAGGGEGEPKPIIIPGIPRRAPDSSEAASNLTQLLNSSGLGNNVKVQTNIEGSLLSLGEKLTFTPGTADLNPQALPVLMTVTTMLKDNTNNIRVVGHTDTTPPVDKRFASNWELSTYRAVVVANQLIKNGIDPKRIQVSGRGEYEPLFDNTTPQNRLLNSRVELMVIYKVQDETLGSRTNGVR